MAQSFYIRPRDGHSVFRRSGRSYPFRELVPRRARLKRHSLPQGLGLALRNRSIWYRSQTSPLSTPGKRTRRSEEHTSELQSHSDLVCRLLLEKKKKTST